MEEVERLRAQLSRLPEAESLDLLRDFHCYYYPPGVGLTVDAWLLKLRARAAGHPG